MMPQALGLPPLRLERPVARAWGPRASLLREGEAGSHRGTRCLLDLFTYLFLYRFDYVERRLLALIDEVCSGWARRALRFPHGGARLCLPSMAGAGAAAQKRRGTHVPSCAHLNAACETMCTLYSLFV